MKFRIAGIIVAALLWAVPASAQLSFAFSFNDISRANNVVRGTISGLQEGNNAGAGVTAAITSSFDATALGTGYNFVNVKSTGQSAFVVTNGQISFASAKFASPSFQLYLGNNYSTTYYPELFNPSTNSDQYNDSVGNNIMFTALAPEPAAWGLMILGFGMVGGVMRHRRRRYVSSHALAG